MDNKKPLVLLTGVTGYVGGRLQQLLEEQGYPLRCLVRSTISIPEKISSLTQYVVGDASDKKSLMKALDGVEVAFYLIHSLGISKDFGQIDRELAALFGHCAARSHLKRIIYLGGLGGNYDEELSPHLKSRHEVGNVLRANVDGVQVIELRASIVIGSGSLSFEMIRALVDRLPIMITPKWVNTKAQPIAIDDLLKYLAKAIDISLEGNPIFEIGGKNQVSYRGLMREYAHQKGIRNWMIPVPLLTPRLSSLWLGLITPLYVRVGRKLVESALCPTVVHDPLGMRLFQIEPMSVKEAIKQAIECESNLIPKTRWNDPVSSSGKNKDWSGIHFGGRFIAVKTALVAAPPENAFKPIRTLGGKHGYPRAKFLWWLRGACDLLVGGVGMRRGRRDPENLQKGDVLDFWRVEAYKPNQYLKLAAEMKVPGRAWLEFEVEPCSKGSKITQRATFDPAGVVGVLYWYLLYPLHKFVFSRLLQGLVNKVKED